MIYSMQRTKKAYSREVIYKSHKMKVTLSINAKPAGHICTLHHWTHYLLVDLVSLHFAAPRWNIDSQWANAHYSLQGVRTRLRERL